MKKVLPLSIISLVALVATPVLADQGHRGPGKRGQKVVDARQLRGEVNQAERSLQRLREKLRRICRRDCRGIRADIRAIDSALDNMDRTLKQAQPSRNYGSRSDRGPPASLSHVQVSALRTRLLKDRYDSRRIDRLKKERPPLTVHKTVAVLAAFHYDSSRMTALQILSPYIVDPENFALIDSAFRHRSSRERAQSIIARRAGYGSGAYAQAPPPPATNRGRGRRAP